MRTAAKDANYLSLNADSVVWFAGTDQERQDGVLAMELSHPLARLPDLVPEDPKAWDSALKASGRQYTYITELRVAQGKENALDCNNRTAHCSFDGGWGIIGREGEQVFTIKGGSHHIKVSGTVHSRGTDCDLEIGAWSDQSFDTSHTLDFSDLKHVTGRPLTFVFGRVNSPLMTALGRPKDIKLPPGAKVLFWASIGEQIYWWAKWSAVKVGILR